MKTLEVRRHGLRKHGGGSQLSQQGVDAARRLGSTLGPYALVAASVVPRARETAIAMGFAVDYELVTLASGEEFMAEAEASRWWESPQPFAVIAAQIAQGGAVYRYAHAIAALWRDMLTPLPDGAAALFVGHSGELELAVAACAPHADYCAWGPMFGPLEGALLRFGGVPERFLTADLLRSEG